MWNTLCTDGSSAYLWSVVRTTENLEGKVLHLFPCRAWRRREFSYVECRPKNVIILEVVQVYSMNSKLNQSFHLLKTLPLFLNKLIVHLFSGMNIMVLTILVVFFPPEANQDQYLVFSVHLHGIFKGKWHLFLPDKLCISQMILVHEG